MANNSLDFLDLAVIVDGFPYILRPGNGWKHDLRQVTVTTKSRQGVDDTTTGEHIPSVSNGPIMIKKEDLPLLREWFACGHKGGVTLLVNHGQIIRYDGATITLDSDTGLNGADAGEITLKVEGSNVEDIPV